MTQMESLQQRSGLWHRERFPYVRPDNIALKIAEEAGELCSAVNGSINPSYGKGDVGGEAADVVLAVMALIDRFYPWVDLGAEIEKKYAVLIDRTSSHPSSLRPDIEP